jgi:hypothetical protein
VEEGNGYSIGGEPINPFVGLGVRRERSMVANNTSKYKAGFKRPISKFQGCLQPKEFLDWVAVVEEILDFNKVHDDRQVPLVATTFKEKATAWWGQAMQGNVRQEKPKISSFEKLLKHMRETFLTLNYVRTIYQWLQNL